VVVVLIVLNDLTVYSIQREASRVAPGCVVRKYHGSKGEFLDLCQSLKNVSVVYSIYITVFLKV